MDRSLAIPVRPAVWKKVRRTCGKPVDCDMVPGGTFRDSFACPYVLFLFHIVKRLFLPTCRLSVADAVKRAVWRKSVLDFLRKLI
ncbi:hypothetical protein ACFQFS_04030 [Novosphingobium lubricantis]